jgi:ribosomal protein S27E
MMTSHVDGNALAGPLSEIFLTDMTSASGRCAGCGDISPLAMAMVYTKPKAFIVRCHVCDSVLITLIQSSDRNWIDLEGLTALTIAR